MAITQASAAIWPLLDANDVAGVREALARHPEEINAFSGIAGGTLLHEAADKSSPDVLRALIDLGFDVNLASNFEGVLPITNAASRGKVANVQLLIDCGSKLDVSEPVRNPLYGAITAGRGHSEEHIMIRAPEVADALLKAGLDFAKKYPKRGNRERNAYEKAHNWGAREIRDMISIWTREKALGGTPELPFEAAFYKAVSAHDLTSVRSLCETFADKFEGASPLYDGMPTSFGSWLHCAAVNSSPEIASYLIGRGERIEGRSRGWTPLYTAAGNANVRMVRYLLDAGAKLHLEHKNNPLLAAVRANSLEVAELLLEAGMDPRPKFDFVTSHADAEGWARNSHKFEIADLIAAYK